MSGRQYFEYAKSAGEGLLVEHVVIPDDYDNSLMEPRSGQIVVAQTLTEQEAQAFYTMHGDSWVAV